MAAHPETGKVMKPKNNFRRHRLTVSLTTLSPTLDDRVSVTHICRHLLLLQTPLASYHA
jgi:hypothetical protein